MYTSTMSLRTRKPTICICKTKDQHLSFHYTDSTIPLLKSKISSPSLLLWLCFCGQFVSDLVENQDCWFSHAKAQIIKFLCHYLWLYSSCVKGLKTGFLTNNSKWLHKRFSFLVGLWKLITMISIKTNLICTNCFIQSLIRHNSVNIDVTNWYFFV